MIKYSYENEIDLRLKIGGLKNETVRSARITLWQLR